jgi:beta-phosphoglucomutase-like phosphatase (HAD superfamily)
MSERFDLIIFDCDGVVVDSERIVHDVFTQFVRELGLDLPAGEIHERFLGVALADCLEVVSRLTGRSVPEGAIDDYRRRRDRVLRDGVQPIELFAGRVYSATDVARGKPAPDVFLHAAAQMGASARRTVVIEDSVNGVLAARAAGMTAFGFVGLTPVARLAEAGAEKTFAGMRELPVLLAAPPPRG